MTYKKLTSEQRQIKHWRERRNAIVGRLLAANPDLLSSEALKTANRMMGRMPGKRIAGRRGRR